MPPILSSTNGTFWRVVAMVRASRQRVGERLRALMDLLHDAVLVLELEDRVLELPLQGHPIGDHDLVEDLRVGGVLRAGEAVRSPRDRVGLPGAGGALE
jgi:hypothetical protein